MAGSSAALLEYLSKFNFDTDAPRIFSTDGAFGESAMSFMTPPDVGNPRLTEFSKRGGKLIVYHGNSDAVFSINDTMRWYDKLSANSGGNAAATARLFPVPGMAHCSGGPATDQFDSLGALVDWVEKGTAPERLIATVKAGNAEIPATWAQTRTRPLCVYPKVATYNGTGSIEEAASFSCR